MMSLIGKERAAHAKLEPGNNMIQLGPGSIVLLPGTGKIQGKI